MEDSYTFDTNTVSTGSEVSAGAALPFVLIGLAVTVLMLAAAWRVYTKAGRPGWAALIPIYNTYVLLKMAGRPGWWLLLYFIPLVNFVVSLIVLYDIAKAFGKDVGFMLLLLFLPFIGWPLLAWGSATYKQPTHA